MIRRPPRSTQSRSSAASDVYKRQIKDGELKIKQGYTPLPIKSHPITVTTGKISNHLIVDPWLEEEQVMDSRITFATKEDGTICAIQKGGSGYFTPQQILEASKIALDKAAEPVSYT